MAYGLQLGHGDTSPADQDVIIDIAVTNPITHSAGTTQVKSLTSIQPFTLAGGTLTITGPFQVNGSVSFEGGSLITDGNITLTASGNLTINSVIDAGTGVMRLDAPNGSIFQTGGSVMAGTAILNAATGISLNTGSIANLQATNTMTGNTSIVGMTGALNVAAGGVINSAAAGDASLTTTGALTLTGDVTVQAGWTVSLNGQTITQTGGEPFTDTLFLTSVNGTTMTNLVATQLSAVNTGAGNIFLNVLTDVTIVAPGLTNLGGNITLTVAGDLTIGADVNLGVGGQLNRRPQPSCPRRDPSPREQHPHHRYSHGSRDDHEHGEREHDRVARRRRDRGDRRSKPLGCGQSAHLRRWDDDHREWQVHHHRCRRGSARFPQLGPGHTLVHPRQHAHAREPNLQATHRPETDNAQDQ